MPALDLEEDREVCTICHDSLLFGEKGDPVAALRCGHLHHRQCIVLWLTSNARNRCPQCNGEASCDDVRTLSFALEDLPEVSEQDIREEAARRVEALHAKGDVLERLQGLEKAENLDPEPDDAEGRLRKAFQEELEQMEKLKSLEAQLSALESEAETLTGESKQMAQDILAFRDERKGLEERNARLAAEASEAALEVASKSEAAAKLQQDLDARQATLGKRLSRWPQEGDADLESERKKLRTTSVRAKDRAKHLHEGLVASKQLDSASFKTFKDRVKQVDEREKEVSKVRQEFESLSAQLQERKAELARERAKLGQLSQETTSASELSQSSAAPTLSLGEVQVEIEDATPAAMIAAADSARSGGPADSSVLDDDFMFGGGGGGGRPGNSALGGMLQRGLGSRSGSGLGGLGAKGTGALGRKPSGALGGGLGGALGGGSRGALGGLGGALARPAVRVEAPARGQNKLKALFANQGA